MIQEVSIQQEYIERSIQKHCKFCRSVGHNISQCRCEEADKLHKNMCDISTFSYMFPVIKDAFINYKLKKLTLNEMKVLLNYIEIPFYERRFKRTKENLMKALLKVFYILPSEENDTYFMPHIENMISNEFYLLCIYSNEINNLFPNMRFTHLIRDELHEMRRFREIQEREDREEEERERELNPHKFNISISIIQDKNEDNENITNEYECPICYDDKIKKDNIIKTNCNHLFCGICIANYLDATSKLIEKKTLVCPMCRCEINTLEFNNKELCIKIQKNFCS